MAEFNTCADLIDETKYDELSQDYQNLLIDGKDPLADMLSVQNELQIALSSKLGRTPAPLDIKNKGELVDFLLDQKLALDDEFRELIEAIHGMSRPESERSACWKKWKSKHDDIRSELINENLTLDDQKERSFEAIDMMHFVFNILLALGIESDDLYIYYMLKNKENFERQKRGY